MAQRRTPILGSVSAIDGDGVEEVRVEISGRQKGRGITCRWECTPHVPGVPADGRRRAGPRVDLTLDITTNRATPRYRVHGQNRQARPG